MHDLSDVAVALFAIAAGGGVAAAVSLIADRAERRKWARAEDVALVDEVLLHPETTTRADQWEAWQRIRASLGFPP